MAHVRPVGCKLCWARFCDVEIATHFTMTCYFVSRATSGEIRFTRNQITNLTSALAILVKKPIETTFAQTFFKHFSDVHIYSLRHEAPNGLRNPQKRGTPNLIILPTSSFCRVHALLDPANDIPTFGLQ